MRREDLDLLFERQPRPVLRLYLTGGMMFEIRDPEQVVVTDSTVELLLPSDGPRDREAVISLRHITWVEVVTGAVE